MAMPASCTNTVLAKRLASSTMTVLTPLATMRSSSALKPGRTSIGSAPCVIRADTLRCAVVRTSLPFLSRRKPGRRMTRPATGSLVVNAPLWRRASRGRPPCSGGLRYWVPVRGRRRSPIGRKRASQLAFREHRERPPGHDLQAWASVSLIVTAAPRGGT
jgi:hypothetical protein